MRNVCPYYYNNSMLMIWLTNCSLFHILMGYAYSISVKVPLALRYFLRRMYVSSKWFAIVFYVKSLYAKRCHDRLHSTTCSFRVSIRSMGIRSWFFDRFRSEAPGNIYVGFVTLRRPKEIVAFVHLCLVSNAKRRDVGTVSLRTSCFFESLIKFL